MSVEQLLAFSEKIMKDDQLAMKMEALPKDDLDAAISQGIAIANEAGFYFTPETLIAFNTSVGEAHINESGLEADELEAVAGGRQNSSYDVLAYGGTESSKYCGKCLRMIS